MKLSTFIKAIIAIVIAEAAGLLGSLFTFPSIGSWYVGLAKPQLAPPNAVFGPVWTTLFALMGIASYLVWQKGREGKSVKIPLTTYAVQLVLNILWSVIFFGFHAPGLALIEIIILWIAILATIILFAKVSKLAAILLVPYIAWVSFAMYLNYAIWRLN